MGVVVPGDPAAVKDFGPKVWSMWFTAMEDVDWDLREVRDYFDGSVPLGVEVLHWWWSGHKYDAVAVGAAIDSLAEVMEAWSPARMELHLEGLQVEYKEFADFGYEQRTEHLPEVPDDLLIKGDDGCVDYNAIGEYYVTSRDLVREGSDGRVFFFTRPGLEGTANTRKKTTQEN